MRLIAFVSFSLFSSSRSTCRPSISFVIGIFPSRCFVMATGDLTLFQHARRALALTPRSWAFRLAHSGTFEPTGVWGSTVVSVGYRLTTGAKSEGTLLTLPAVNTAVPADHLGRVASLTALAPGLYPAPPRGVTGGGWSVGGGVQVVWVPKQLDLAPSDVRWDVD